MSKIITKNTSLTKKLLYLCFCFSFISPLASQIIFSGFSYIFDILIFLMIFTICVEFKSKIAIYGFMWPILLYLIIILFSAIFNMVKISLFIWAFRNAFRGFILLYISFVVLDKDDVFYLKKCLYKIAYLNFLVCLIEAAAGFNWDYLGGLFGIEKGGNGYLTLFLAIVCGFAFNDYLSGTIKLKQLIFILLTSFIEAAIGEMKFCLILVIFIAFLSLLINGGLKRVKNWIVFIIFAISALFGLILIAAIYENSNMLSIDFFINYFDKVDRGYNSIGDVNRTTFIKVLNEFFDFNLIEKLFGIGFGAGEVSNMSIFQSTVGQKYADLLHYNWFQSSFVYLETGILGLITIVLFYINLLVKFIRERKNSLLYKDGILIVVIGLIFVFYNSVLRDSFGLFYYVILAFPLVTAKSLYITQKSVKMKLIYI